jgi:hypothetical protein
MFQTLMMNRNAQNVVENDRTPSNLRTAALSGRDSITDTLGAAEVAIPNYSKRPSGKSPPLLTRVFFVSILPDLC